MLNDFGLLYGMPSYGPAFWIINLILFVFWISQIIDCARRQFDGSGKVVWMLVIILLGWIGALIYLLAGKKQGRLLA